MNNTKKVLVMMTPMYTFQMTKMCLILRMVFHTNIPTD